MRAPDSPTAITVDQKDYSGIVIELLMSQSSLLRRIRFDGMATRSRSAATEMNCGFWSPSLTSTKDA